MLLKMACSLAEPLWKFGVENCCEVGRAFAAGMSASVMFLFMELCFSQNLSILHITSRLGLADEIARGLGRRILRMTCTNTHHVLLLWSTEAALTVTPVQVPACRPYHSDSIYQRMSESDCMAVKLKAKTDSPHRWRSELR